LHLEALLKLFWAANSREPADVKERHEWASPADYLRPVNPLQILTISDIEQELARVDAHAPMLQLGSTPASVEQIDALIGRANGSRTITVTYRERTTRYVVKGVEVTLTEDALENSGVDISVKSGVVTLSGTVASAAGRTRAVAIAKGTEGVKDVKDSLKVAKK